MLILRPTLLHITPLSRGSASRVYLCEQEEKLEVESELKDCKVNLEKSNKDLLDLQENYRVAISTLKEKEFIISKLLYSENSLVERAKELRNGLQSASEDITSLFTTLDQKDQMETNNQRMVLRFGSQLDQSLKDLHKSILGSVSQQQHHIRCMEEHAQSFLASKCDVTKALESRIRKLTDAYSSGIESLKEYANAMRENSSSDLDQLNTRISSQGLERSLRHAQLISKATMDFFVDINVQASKVMTVLEESQTKQFDWLSNFHQTFQEETVREEKHALEDIAKILGNSTSKRTAIVPEASRNMQGMRREEHKNMKQEINYIHQVSSDANEELRRYVEEVKRNFMEDSF